MNNLVGIQKWLDLDGDNTLALDWPLNEDSQVWEIGGFEGRWVQQMWDKFHCNITIFEPQIWAVNKLAERFKGNEKISIRPYGLWTDDDVFPLGKYGTDGASVIGPIEEPYVNIEVRDVFREIRAFTQIKKIDLALMNIEGAEFTILPALLRKHMLAHFNYFWCQFHPGLVEDGEKKASRIFSDMYVTHNVLWECYPTAVAWKRR